MERHDLLSLSPGHLQKRVGGMLCKGPIRLSGGEIRIEGMREGWREGLLSCFFFVFVFFRFPAHLQPWYPRRSRILAARASLLRRYYGPCLLRMVASPRNKFGFGEGLRWQKISRFYLLHPLVFFISCQNGFRLPCHHVFSVACVRIYVCMWGVGISIGNEQFGNVDSNQARKKIAESEHEQLVFEGLTVSPRGETTERMDR